MIVGPLREEIQLQFSQRLLPDRRNSATDGLHDGGSAAPASSSFQRSRMAVA